METDVISMHCVDMKITEQPQHESNVNVYINRTGLIFVPGWFGLATLHVNNIQVDRQIEHYNFTLQ